MRTLIEGGYIIAWQEGQHRLLRNGQIVFEDDKIVYTGKNFSGEVDYRVDAHNTLVIPGLINIHCHTTDTPYTRGFLEDQGSKGLEMSGLYEYLPAVRRAIHPEDELSGAKFSLAELLLSGTTTAVELGFDTELGMGGSDITQTEEIARIAGEMGIRTYMGPRYKSGHWYTGQEGQVQYEWYEDEGLGRFQKCLNFVKEWDGKYNDRIKTMLAPAQVDTCTSTLLKETAKAVEVYGVKAQIHIGQSKLEFNEMVKRHGLSPVEYLKDIGLLGPNLILGHGLFLTSHSDIEFSRFNDLDLVLEAGTSVAHCPMVFARRGISMHSFSGYLKKGINMGLGTDTFPMDILHEMRVANLINKHVEKSSFVATAEDVFNAATIGGAKALGRDDLGKIAPGCKADIVIVDLESTNMSPVRDPLKNLVYNAAGKDVKTVYVDGRVVVHDKKLVHGNEQKRVKEIQDAAEKVWGRMPELDRLAPSSLNKFKY